MKHKTNFNLKKEIKLLPGYIILSLWVLFTVVLIGWIFAASFSTTKEIFTGGALKFESGFHYENYINAFKGGTVPTILINSFIYSSVSSVILILVCAPASYVLSRFKFIGNLVFQRSLAGAMGVPLAMIILPLVGVVSFLNISSFDITVRLLMIFLYVGINIPFTIIFLLTFFVNLSRSFEEAAAIDGCTPVQTFWKIMMPLAQPGIITVSIFNFINIWNEYFMTLIFASSENVRNVAVGLYSMIEAMKYTGNWAGMFTAVIIVFLPTFILYIFLSDRIIEGVTGGAIKG